jgi:Cdc6-like AAA superfamily ATPase
MPPARPLNPFRIHGVVDGEFHTDRDTELATFLAALREPTAKLLVSGHRRMGKTSTLERAVRAVNDSGGYAILADLSTATTVADMANRILGAAAKTLGRRWQDFIGDLTGSLKLSLKMQYDPATQSTMPSLELGAREQGLASQQESLAQVLDTLDAMAARRNVTLGVVLDEFQEIARFGGGGTSGRRASGATRRRGRLGDGTPAGVGHRDDQPEWHLRGAMQRHQHLSYILAGSRRSLLEAMTQPGAAFYKMLDPVKFGPIDALHMSTWIDDRMRSVGLIPDETGARCVAWTGPRTRDIVRLARKCVDRAQPDSVVNTEVVTNALREIIDEEHDAFAERWSRLTANQQNVLRAVAATEDGLTTQESRRAFTLGATGTVTNTLRLFVDDGVLVRTIHGAGYTYDDPFFRSWVIAKVLGDVGKSLPITHVASRTSEYD